MLSAFDSYCQRNGIQLQSLKIEHIDAFQGEFFKDLSSSTRHTYRNYLRRFLNYLYHERRIVTTDLAPMVIGRREYAQSKPPKFLRPAEVQQLFASLSLSSASDIRTYAIVHLAYTMGLRPKEISLVRFNDISFRQRLLRLTVRKGDNPLELPVPEHTLKAGGSLYHRRQTENETPPIVFNPAPAASAIESQCGRMPDHFCDETSRFGHQRLLAAAHLCAEPARSRCVDL